MSESVEEIVAKIELGHDTYFCRTDLLVLIASWRERGEALRGLVSDRHGHEKECVCPWCRARAALGTSEEEGA